jgi:hypothetical protein
MFLEIPASVPAVCIIAGNTSKRVTGTILIILAVSNQEPPWWNAMNRK